MIFIGQFGSASEGKIQAVNLTMFIKVFSQFNALPIEATRITLSSGSRQVYLRIA
jgi:hypothetical protein